MNLTPEIFAEIFRQSAFISALTAGFSFAFLGVILTDKSKQRVCDWTAGFAIAATAGLIVCALGWTFSIPRILALSMGSAQTGSFQLPETLRTIHRSLSLTFIGCFFLFLTSLGLSGWIRSKVLGIVSITIAFIGACYAIWIMHFFIQ
jgi:hypothetical protein